MKKWYQSKTIWTNVIMGALAIISQVSNVFPIASHPQAWVLTTSVLNIILRFMTSQPIGATPTVAASATT